MWNEKQQYSENILIKTLLMKWLDVSVDFEILNK